MITLQAECVIEGKMEGFYETIIRLIAGKICTTERLKIPRISLPLVQNPSYRNFSTSSDGDTWTEPRTLISGDGARPYIKFASHGEDTIWFAYTDGHPNAEPHNSIYCASYSAGAIRHADGRIIRTSSDLPMLPTEADMVYDAASHGTKAWIWDIATYRDGRPAIVYVVFLSDTDHRYYYSHWNGKSWDNNEITSVGSWFPQTPEDTIEGEPYYSGGITLDRRLRPYTQYRTALRMKLLKQLND